ncbi:hypothetical protein CHU95_07480 [Niveispirillum lacus]|uniref:Amidase domain-containing protein n=1 Tax=Niveispirillum lacus TaxID=1981099 RepID=A0A255Z2A1_9PROT|nr:amidase [Niveispirillum lacus]OYQ35559.1 hypothetical protein CHU95_07480 [Niveispirillum lacus]
MPDFSHIAETALDRITRFDGSLHAFALVEQEWVREEAWRLRKGTHQGPLAGLTLAVKDLLDLRGLPTAGGCRTPVIADAPATAAAVAALAGVGMLTLGKTHTVELAFGTWGINRSTATPRNPWDTSTIRVPGGSSSGSAVAVAAGLADAALGTDTGGSIRIPSALNNLAGLKPTHGRVPVGGCLPLCPELDTIGPMARTVERVARMFGAMLDPASGPAQPGPKLARQSRFDPDAALMASPQGLVVAILPDRFLAGVDSAVGAAYLAALARLEQLGAKLMEVAPIIDPPACVEPSGLLMAARAWRLWQHRVHHHGSEMDAGVLHRLRGGEDVPDAEISRLIRIQAQEQARFYAWAQDFDVVATPTVPIAAPALADADEGRLPFSRFVRIANWLNLPALAVPCGANDAGLPLSLQLLSTPWREAVLVTLGHAYQCATDWADRRPDLEKLLSSGP